VASFIITDEQLQLNRGCCFLVQAMLPGGFPFHQFNWTVTLTFFKFGVKAPSGALVTFCDKALVHVV